MKSNLATEVCNNVLKSKDWVLGNHDGVTFPTALHCFYLVDFSLGHVQLLTLPQAAFNTVNSAPISEAVNAISLLMKKSWTGKIDENEMWLLCSAANCYLKQTETYRVWLAKTNNDPTAISHTIINIYRKGSSKHTAIRASMAHCDGVVLTPAEVIEHARLVRNVDSTMRPFDQQGVKDNLQQS